MKHLKKKLMASVAMMLVSTMMLTSVSFAWYTLSTNPEVRGITATATTNANLEIAYNESTTAPGATGNAGDTGKYNTYGNLVDMADTTATTGPSATGSAWVSLDKNLRPMTTDTTFKYMKYGADGRPSELGALTATAVGNNACGNIQLAATSNNNVQNYGFFVRYWMRTNYATASQANKSSDLYLSTAATRSNDANSETGGGTTITLTSSSSSVSDTDLKELAKNVRIAFSGGASDSNPVVQPASVIVPDFSSANPTWSVTTSTNSVKLTMSNDTDTSIDLTQNTDSQVYMYVYLDGVSMNNEMADALANGNISISYNVQFSNNSMDDTKGMSENGTKKTT